MKPKERSKLIKELEAKHAEVEREQKALRLRIGQLRHMQYKEVYGEILENYDEAYRDNEENFKI